MKVGVIEGVTVAVLLGGSVDVISTKSGWLAAIVTGFDVKFDTEVDTGIAIGDGVGLR